MKVLNPESYESILSMLKSSDEESVRLAFECLNNIPITNENMVYYMFLFMEADQAWKDWEKYSRGIIQDLGEALERVLKIGNGPHVISFPLILKMLKEYKRPVEDIDFFMSRYKEHLEKQIGFKLKIQVYDTPVTS
ncbi:MAG: hypothetical protein E6Q36_09280 [Chryseobacterium sp.]|nr:MAG: hypothetical protein E6Q36_09280 [Chryseobacterium sp.]